MRDGKGVFLRTADIDEFYRLLNQIAVEGLVKIEAVAPADDDTPRHLPVPDRFGWEPVMTSKRLTAFREVFLSQPWGLWWLQARRLVRIELRRNLFSWRARWVYFLAFVPTA